MWISERIAVAYFTVLVIACWMRPVATGRRAVICLTSLIAIAAVWRLRGPDIPLMRLLAPLVQIPVGYYLSGLLWVAPSLKTEAWLQSWDRRLLGENPSRLFVNWPTPILSALALSYMATFLLVPAGIAALLLGGHAALADRFWTIVLGAQFASFSALAIVQTRPPWAFDPSAPSDAKVHGFVARWVERYLIGANTFPSGHVASSFAVALALIGTMPCTGTVILAAAVGIAIATITGRYHYVMDAVTGVLLALAIWIGVVVAF